MTKSDTRRYIILVTIFFVFSVITFAAPFKRNAVFWLAYVFGAVAIAAQFFIFKVAFKEGMDVRSKFYGFPIARVGVIYMAAQLALSLIEMILAGRLPTWIAQIGNALPIAFAVIGIVAADTMREEVEKQDVKVVSETTNMRALISAAGALPALCADEGMKKTLGTLAEEFRYSDPVSSADTKYLELELKQQLGDLKKALVDNDAEAAKALMVKVMDTLAERNRICKASK